MIGPSSYGVGRLGPFKFDKPNTNSDQSCKFPIKQLPLEGKAQSNSDQRAKFPVKQLPVEVKAHSNQGSPNRIPGYTPCLGFY